MGKLEIATSTRSVLVPASYRITFTMEVVKPNKPVVFETDGAVTELYTTTLVIDAGS